MNWLRSLAVAGANLDAIKAAGVIKIGTEGTYAPFTYHDTSNKLVGFDVEIGEAIAKLLGASGEVAAIDSEALMDAVTAVSGSGPAYIFHFIECLTAAGEKAGLPAETAELLAMQTVYGAASLAAASDEAPGRLREQVTSPNGTTAAALGVLMGGDRLKTLVEEAVEAARKRSVELG